jgi:hypothetical protein
MNSTIVGARMRLLTAGLGLAIALGAAIFVFGAESTLAQTADFDGDGYADDLEEQLGSNQNDPDSTPEHFALLWSCTDGNDNDKDGGRDFRDDGCESAVPASPTPTPAPSGGGTPTPGSGGSNGGGSGGGTSGNGGGTGTSGSGNGSSGSGDGNAVFAGSNAPPGDSGSGDTSDTGAGDGSGDSTTTDAISTDAGGDAGAENAASDDSGGGDSNGFPWKPSLLILAVGLVLAALIYALTSARSRRMSGR